MRIIPWCVDDRAARELSPDEFRSCVSGRACYVGLPETSRPSSVADVAFLLIRYVFEGRLHALDLFEVTLKDVRYLAIIVNKSDMESVAVAACACGIAVVPYLQEEPLRSFPVMPGWLFSLQYKPPRRSVYGA